MRTLNPCDYPADRVMLGEYLENLPADEAADMIDEYRDRAEDEAGETLREETEYWHGMSEVGPEWFFEELEN